MQFKNVCADVTRGISDVEKKLVHIEKVPHEDNEASRDVEKSLMHVSDVLMQVDSAIRALGENPFVHLFFLSVMHEEKNDVVFSIPEVHPSAILHTFSAFVLKRRASVRNPAGAVDNDDTVQRTAVAGREAGTADIQKLAMRASYGALVSQDATVRKNILTSKPWSGLSQVV